mgnify:CR=1 FL=1
MSKGDFPAFPTQSNGGDIYGGVTVREHFAAMAMQGLLASCESQIVFQTHRDDGARNSIAELAVRHADLLLAELNK